jgi:hypothetical protein
MRMFPEKLWKSCQVLILVNSKLLIYVCVYVLGVVQNHDLPASTYQVLRLQACTTHLNKLYTFYH